MIYRALVSFTGVIISMAAGEVREIPNPSVVNDLIRAGYIELVNDNPENNKPVNKGPVNEEKKVTRATRGRKKA